MGAMEWSPVRRVAFRFWFLVGALLLFPFPLGIIPKTEGLAEIANKPFEWAMSWVANGLGLDEPVLQPTGSGDTYAAFIMHLSVAILAALGTVAWTVLDRRRTSHRHLADAAIVVLRYYLATTLLIYAFAKLTQFPPPNPSRLDQRVGDLSPMGVLWTFMGASRPYSLFAGFTEALGGVLLLWRPTYVAGALIAVGAMGNVVALNFCYDVPVKLYSMQLLAIAIVIFAPHARRVIRAMLGRAVPEVPLRPRRSLWDERVRLAAKLLFLAALVAQIYSGVDRALGWTPPEHELHGIWVVDRMSIEGVERPPLLTDTERWHKLHFSQVAVAVRPMDGLPTRFSATVDPEQHRIEINEQELHEIWRYTLARGEPDALVVEGAHRGKPFRAELHREPPPLLVTRGFHWIQEVPFNR